MEKYPNVEKTLLYDSYAKDNYRIGSDIDLILVGTELDLSQMFQIEIELHELMLPYKIDLALLQLIEIKELLDHIQRIGVVFYEKNN